MGRRIRVYPPCPNSLGHSSGAQPPYTRHQHTCTPGRHPAVQHCHITACRIQWTCQGRPLAGGWATLCAIQRQVLLPMTALVRPRTRTTGHYYRTTDTCWASHPPNSTPSTSPPARQPADLRGNMRQRGARTQLQWLLDCRCSNSNCRFHPTRCWTRRKDA